MAEHYFDLADVDSFGSNSEMLGRAMDALRFDKEHGSLLYVAGTDGMSSSGRRPDRALAAYGAYTQANPSCNEQGLRVLIGGAVQQAALRGLQVTPVFSLYSAHGPVFRAMLRVKRGRDQGHGRYGFIAHQPSSGRTAVVPFSCAASLLN